MTRPGGIFKRRADVPRLAQATLNCLSKADLLEMVWNRATFEIGDSAEDRTIDYERLVSVLEDFLHTTSSPTREATAQRAVKALNAVDKLMREIEQSNSGSLGP